MAKRTVTIDTDDYKEYAAYGIKCLWMGTLFGIVLGLGGTSLVEGLVRWEPLYVIVGSLGIMAGTALGISWGLMLHKAERMLQECVDEVEES